MPLVFGGLGLVIAALLGAVWLVPKSAPPPAVAPVMPTIVEVPTTPRPVAQPAVQVAGVKLTLESAPSGSEVFEEDVLLGTTPLTVSRPSGTLTTFRCEAKGFTALTRKVRFEADTTLRFELVEVAAKAVGKRPRPAQPAEDDLKDAPF
jgi:hypothetical protein